MWRGCGSGPGTRRRYAQGSWMELKAANSVDGGLTENECWGRGGWLRISAGRDCEKTKILTGARRHTAPAMFGCSPEFGAYWGVSVSQQHENGIRSTVSIEGASLEEIVDQMWRDASLRDQVVFYSPKFAWIRRREDQG